MCGSASCPTHGLCRSVSSSALSSLGESTFELCESDGEGKELSEAAFVVGAGGALPRRGSSGVRTPFSRNSEMRLDRSKAFGASRLDKYMMSKVGRCEKMEKDFKVRANSVGPQSSIHHGARGSITVP